MQAHMAAYEHYSNDEVNEVVFAGIHSSDAAVVRRTVETVSWEAKMVWARRAEIERSGNNKRVAALRDELRRARNFAAVPGLRDFLVGYVRQGVSRDGWAAAAVDGPEVGERPVWASVPGALLTYFPGDPEVETLLLDFYRATQQERPEVASHALHLLNIGRFGSAELEATRIEALNHRVPSVAGYAAAGLAASATEDGLAALGASLARRDEALGEIVLAILGHGARARPYLPKLRELHRKERELARFLAPLPIHPDGVFHAMNRVELLANREAFLGPESLEHVHRLEQIIADQSRYDDADVNNIVFEGIHSGDPAAVAHTVGAVGRATVTNGLRAWLSAHARQQPQPPGNALGDQMRSFHKVLGLRDFLLAYVRRGMADIGVADFRSQTPSAWTYGFHTLAVLFPSDREVRRTLLELHGELQRAGHSVAGPLRMLNAGRFYGDEVDALRAAALKAGDPLAAQAAARGLAMTLTDAGLAALVDALARRDAALADIAQAIGSFGVRARPHRDRLRTLAERPEFASTPVGDRIAQVVANLHTPEP